MPYFRKRNSPLWAGHFVTDHAGDSLVLKLRVLLRTLPVGADAIERQLSHKGQGMRAVYNKAEYMDERHKMMQAWADHLDTLRTLPVPLKRCA
jgi:hypothetical protein